MPALLVLVAVTAVRGVTFVQVKDAVAAHPLFALLALRFAIAGCTLAAPGAARLRSLGRPGARVWGAPVGDLGFVVTMAGIVVAEPAAAATLARLVRRPRAAST